MPVSWTDLTSALLGAGARIGTALWDALERNDEAALDHVFQMEYAQTDGASPHPTFATLISRVVVVPPGANVLRLEMSSFMLNPGTGYLKATLNGTMDSDTVSFTSTAPADRILTFADVSSFRGTERTLEIKAAVTGGTVSIISLSYALCRWSWD